ncbi:hypothetical protein WJX72_008155 [[Myrmecia] bisecta]|uniref:Glycosyl transferase family 25 domain-containing protein n=1 Tax=[Myrmecia] bisecta TaxID=41462 RepID=A0AAW1QRR9_9CHLO
MAAGMHRPRLHLNKALEAPQRRLDSEARTPQAVRTCRAPHLLLLATTLLPVRSMATLRHARTSFSLFILSLTAQAAFCELHHVFRPSEGFIPEPAEAAQHNQLVAMPRREDADLYQAFVVNLRPSRHARMVQVLKAANLSATFVGAVTYNSAFVKHLLKEMMYWPYGPAPLACWRSHYAIWEHIVERNISMAVIFEDDIDLELDVATTLPPVLRTQPKAGWDIAYLGGCDQAWDEGSYTVVDATYKLHTPHMVLCTHAYILTLRGAHQLVGELGTIHEGVDHEIRFIWQRENPPITAMLLQPNLAVQLPRSRGTSDVTQGDTDIHQQTLRNSTVRAIMHQQLIQAWGQTSTYDKYVSST